MIARPISFVLATAFFVALAPLVYGPLAYAQDVPGIEICTAEKTMERRTGCLQSNVNFLQASLTKQTLDHARKLDASNRQIEALRVALAELQKTVADMRTDKTKAETKEGAPKPPEKGAQPATK